MKRSSSFFFTLVLAAMAVAFFLGLYRPVSHEIRGLRTRISQCQRRGAEEPVVTHLLAQERESLAELESEVEGLTRCLLPEEGITGLMSDLRERLQDHGLEQNAIHPRGRHARDPFEVVKVEVKARGGFEEVYRFTRELERLDIAVRIDRMDIRRLGYSAEAELEVTWDLSAPLNRF